LSGCGYCTGDNGLAGKCIAGTASSSLSMSSSREICSDGPPAAGGSPVGRGTWIFGNWTAYYNSGHWDSRCMEQCRSGQVTRATASRGTFGLGHVGTGVSYAPGANCTWLIWPTPWPVGTRMEVKLSFSALAARGDILWVHHAVWAHGAFGRGDSIGYAGCPLDISRRCFMNFRATVLAPVVVTFYSGYPETAPTSTGVATWIVDWALEWTISGSQGLHPGSSLQRNSREGSGLSSFIWIAMASMLLMPLLATLICMGWRWRRPRPAGARNSVSSGFVSRRPQAVDIEALERELPSCRPRIIGSNEAGEAANSACLMPSCSLQQAANEDNTLSVEEGGTNLCSVCLAGFESGDEVRSLPCNHNFHRSCIDVWLQRSGMCPLCRRMVLPHLPPVPASSSRSPRIIGAPSMASRPFTTQLRGSTARSASARPLSGGGVVRPSSFGSVTRGVNDRGHRTAAGAAERDFSGRARVSAAGTAPVRMQADEESDEIIIEI